MTMRCRHDCILLLCAMVTVVTASTCVLAQSSYPTRPVRIVVPGPPGAAFDTVARLMTPGLTERLGRQVLVENRAGAGTIIGTEVVARAVPDGHTLLMCATAHVLHPAFYKKMRYDGLRDFAPITQTAVVPNVLVVHPSLPAKSVKELIAIARARPGEILFASAGMGTSSHLAMELFASMARIRLTHVAYKGAPPGVFDLLAGNVTVMASSTSSLLPHVRTGKLRALGVTSARRVSVAPEIPTVDEAGLRGYEAVAWYGLLAPAGTPREIVARLHRESVEVLRSQTLKERVIADGAEAVASASPEEFAGFLQAETVRWGRILKAAGVMPE